MTIVHASACVGDEVQLGENVEIGPRCTLTGPIRLGDGVRLVGDIYLTGPLEIGAGTIIYPFSSLGFPPQDVKFKPGDPSPGIVVGKNCTIREHSTIHQATHETEPTRLGDNGFLMVNAHIAHDCQVGSNVTMVNNTSLGGHCVVEDRVIISGHSAIHQFVRIGYLAFLGGTVALTCDAPPFALIGRRNEITGVNVVGMRRAGFCNADITQTRKAFREAFRSNMQRNEVLGILDEIGRECEPVARVATFLRAAGRPICHGTLGRANKATC